MARPRKRRGVRGAIGSSRIFTDGEKKGLLVGYVFRGENLDGVDFSGTDLRTARFENTSLRKCDFSATRLLGTRFLQCDLRSADFTGAKFEDNRFDESRFMGASGLSKARREYIQARGGLFLRVLDGQNTASISASRLSAVAGEKTRG